MSQTMAPTSAAARRPMLSTCGSNPLGDVRGHVRADKEGDEVEEHGPPTATRGDSTRVEDNRSDRVHRQS